MIRGFIAGWCAGICGLLVGHPFDTVKVRQQVYHHGKMRTVFWNLFKAEGPLGFYRGVTFPLLMAGVQKSLYFGIYSNTLNKLQAKCVSDDQTEHRICAEKHLDWQFVQVYTAGACAGFGHAIVACPIDLIKVRIQALQLSGTVMKGRITTVVKDIYRTTGIFGFYRAFLFTMLRDVPSGGLFVFLHEKFLSWGFDRETNTYSTAAKILSGGAAGSLTWVSVMPIDVVKSRIQADNLYYPKFTGYFDCIRKSYKEGGLMIFTRGCLVSIMRGFPVNVITFIVYEFAYNNLSFLN